MTEAQAVRYTTQTEGWAIIEAEIHRSLDYHRGRLEDCKTWDEVQQHRGAIRALTAVLSHVEQTIREEVEEGGEVP
jgi:hypothetical protein